MAESEDTPLLNSETSYDTEQPSESRSDPPSSPIARARKIAFANVEGTIDSPLEFIILFIILLNVVLLGASTILADPNCFGSTCLRWGDKYSTFFELAEAISVYIFTFEYVLRIWACVEHPHIAPKGPVWGRIVYAFSFFPIIDFLSIAPYWAFMFVKEESPDFTTALRVFRLIRLLKADKYVNAFMLLGKVLAENYTLLVASSFYAAVTWIVCSAALHVLEINNPALGNHFQSIPQAMFVVLLMLTGEFPLADFTPAGQVVAGIIAVIAVAIFAVPSALFASSFVKAMQESMGRDFTVDVG